MDARWMRMGEGEPLRRVVAVLDTPVWEMIY